MGIEIVQPEGIWETIKVSLDKLFNWYEKVRCDCCRKEFVLPRTLCDKYQGKSLRCSDECALWHG